MKLGFLTADYKDMEKAKRLGFAAIELRTSTFSDAGKGDLDKNKVADAKKLAQQTGVAITALAFSPPALDQFQKSFARVFDAAEADRSLATLHP